MANYGARADERQHQRRRFGHERRRGTGLLVPAVLKGLDQIARRRKGDGGHFWASGDFWGLPRGRRE